VHRATADQNCSSLHATIGVARTHHKHAWGGFLEILITNSQASAARELKKDELFVEWLHQIGAASNGPASAEHRMITIPEAFSWGSPLQHGAQWRWNGLSRLTSLDSDYDEPPAVVQRLMGNLRQEYTKQVRPILMTYALEDPESKKLLQGRIEALSRHVISDDATLLAGLRTTRSSMQVIYAPLEMKPRYGASAAQGLRSAAQNAACAAQALSTFQMPPHVRAFLNQEAELSANLAGPPWPLKVKEQWLPLVQWMLTVNEGGVAEPFRLNDTGVTAAAKNSEEGDILACARFLVENQLLLVVPD